MIEREVESIFAPSHRFAARSKAQEGQAAAFTSQCSFSRSQAVDSKGNFFSVVLLADVGAWKTSKKEYIGAVFSICFFYNVGKTVYKCNFQMRK